MPGARRPPGPPAAIVLLVLGAALAGCLADPIAPSGPLSLIEAHTLAEPAARALERTASLVGFVGYEGAAPGFLDARLAAHVPPHDNHGDAPRADGRTAAWVLLYGTDRGGLLRAEVRDGVLAEVERVGTGGDREVQTLWSLNLGGRLLVDSPAALHRIRSDAPEIADHLDRTPQSGVVYASTLAERDSPDGMVLDLAYEVFFGSDNDPDPFTHFARVSHFSGQLLTHGDITAYTNTRTQVLVDETFRLHPLAPTANVEAAVPQPVHAPRLRLDADGHGRFRLRIENPTGHVVAQIDETLLIGARTYERSLPDLASGNHTLRAEATGDITFHLKVEGAIVP